MPGNSEIWKLLLMRFQSANDRNVAMKKQQQLVSINFTSTILLLFLSLLPRLSSSIVHFKTNSSFSFSFIDAPARFAVRVNTSGVCGALYVSDPLDACSSLRTTLRYEVPEKVRFVLIERGNCAFEDKVRNAQDSGFRAAIVYDNRDKRNLVSMIGSSQRIWVHAVFVSKAAGEALKKLGQGEEGECCITPSLEEAAWTVLVISFISLLVIVSVLATFFFTRDRRLHRQGTYHHCPSIDRQIVKVFPCFTFNATCRGGRVTGETCAICLEDYKDGETLRILPCHHEFHTSCVDSWLTKWGTFCPVCKHDMSTATAEHMPNQ